MGRNVSSRLESQLTEDVWKHPDEQTQPLAFPISGLIRVLITSHVSSLVQRMGHLCFGERISICLTFTTVCFGLFSTSSAQRTAHCAPNMQDWLLTLHTDFCRFPEPFDDIVVCRWSNDPTVSAGLGCVDAVLRHAAFLRRSFYTLSRYRPAAT